MAARKLAETPLNIACEKICLICLLLLLLWTSANAATRKDVSDIYFARNAISRGEYLIETGRYLDSLEYFKTAIVATKSTPVVADALLHEASLFSIYLDKPGEAVKIYKKIYTNFPQTKQAESAMYKLGLMYIDFSRQALAVDLFRQYLKRYPKGRFKSSVEFLYNHYSAIHKKPYTGTLTLKPIKIISMPYIRVRIFKGRSVKISGHMVVKLSSVKSKSHYARISLRNGLLFFNGEATDSNRIIIKSSRGFLRMNRQSYRGYFALEPYHNRLIVVNILPIEQYIYSVTTSESYSKWPMETLKAQATASRTYALYQIIHRRSWPFDVVSTTGDQAYKGIKAETKRGIEAVRQTRGVVIMYAGRPILAMYTASTGWYVDNPKYIFGFTYPYLKMKRDPYSSEEPYGHWTKKISVGRLTAKLRKMGIDIGRIINIKPAAMSPTGRIIKSRLIYKGGSKVVRTYTTIRRAVGLKDILTTITRQGNEFIFKGGGYGHGIGYSQWGGKAMANDGKRYNDILSFYYTGAVLRKMW